MTRALAATPSTTVQHSAERVSTPGERTLGVAQGATYIAMGLWPTLSLRSFAMVTGPKPEGWLVKSVGLLLVAIGATLVRGARNGERTSVPTLGVGAGAALGGIALYNAARRRISPVYFADAALHLGFVAAWTGLLGARALRGRKSAASPERIRVAGA